MVFESTMTCNLKWACQHLFTEVVQELTLTLVPIQFFRVKSFKSATMSSDAEAAAIAAAIDAVTLDAGTVSPEVASPMSSKVRAPYLCASFFSFDQEGEYADVRC